VLRTLEEITAATAALARSKRKEPAWRPRISQRRRAMLGFSLCGV